MYTDRTVLREFLFICRKGFRLAYSTSSHKERFPHMKREYHRWYSHRLGLDLGVVVYGHWGSPIMGFPTSAGDEWELEGQGMVGALGEFIDAGRIKFYTVNSINGLSFYNKGAHPFHRSYVQTVFDAYLTEEVVPFIWNDCQSRQAIATMGASFAPITLQTRCSGTPMCSSAVSRCLAFTICAASWTECTTTTSTLIIPWIIFRTSPIHGFTSSWRPAIFISSQVPGHGRRAARPIGFRKFYRAKEFATRSITGDHKADTTGRSGRTKCGNMFRSFIDPDNRTGQIQLLKLITALFNHLILVDPHVAFTSQHIDVGSRFPVGMV